MSREIKYIFIACPYVSNKSKGVRRACMAADTLMTLGAIPFNPLLFHFQDLIHPRDRDIWIAQDRAWLELCDSILRLPGESKGADAEVAYARELGLQIFDDLGGLLRALRVQQRENEDVTSCKCEPE